MENFIFCAVLVTLIDKEHLSFNVLTSILTETRSKPNQNYKVKHFMKILDSRKLLIIFTKNSIFNVWLRSEYASGMSLNVFLLINVRP